MKLKSSNYFYCLLIIFLSFSPLKSEEKIDIWNDKVKKSAIEEKEQTPIKSDTQKLNYDSIKTIELNQNIKIEDGLQHYRIMNSNQSNTFTINYITL